MADSVVGYILGWFLLSMLVGVFAGTRGRNIAGWSLVALLTSPLVAFVILVATPDLAAQERERHERSATNEAATVAASRRVQGADIAIRFEKLRQLRDKDLLTPDEYVVRKQKVIDELEGKRLVESGEEFLGLLIPLVDSNALTADEVTRLKAFAFYEPHTASAAPTKSNKDEASRPCPKCGGMIHPLATTCMHCWAKVPAVR